MTLRGLRFATIVGALGFVAFVAPRDAAPCGNPFSGPHCRDQTQACQNGCPLLSCGQLVANFDDPPNAFSTSFFAGAIGHCASRGNRDAILACAWQEVATNFPEVASNQCMKNGLFASPRTQQALAKATTPPSCPVWNCNTAFRKCQFECPLRDDLSCDAAVSQLDGENGFFWNAVGHCTASGSDRHAIGECAWGETVAKYPGMNDKACVKAKILASPSTNRAIDKMVAAWQAGGKCAFPRDALHLEQGGCNRLEKCLPGCPTDPNASLSCTDAAAELDGNGRMFATAVGHCLKDGMDQNRAMIADCAFAEVTQRYPRLAGNTCLKDKLVASPSGSKAITDVFTALGFVAHNKRTQSFASPEACDHPDGPGHSAMVKFISPSDVGDGYASIPDGLLDAKPTSGTKDAPPGQNRGANEGRLRADLRLAAQTAKPSTCSLPIASMYLGSGVEELGNAFADLSVTGRNAFAEFGQNVAQTYCDELPKKRSAISCAAALPPNDKRPDDAKLVAGCKKALERARKVASYLRDGETLRDNTPAERPRKGNERKALGYIAVSGEDDPPHRPVNVPSSDFPQYDLTVDVEAPLAKPSPKTIRVHTRFTVAQSNPTVLRKGPRAPHDSAWPVLAPDSEVLLFVHGMDSRAEEADDITRALFANHDRSGKNVVVVSVDLPSSGYADAIDYEDVSSLDEIGHPKLTVVPAPIPIAPELVGIPGLPQGLIIPAGATVPDFEATGKTPLLDFIETFIVRFVDTLDQKVPIKGKIKAVMGGSLGGNMTFRLGRRIDAPWIPKVVVWSPASIWPSLGEGINIPGHVGVRDPWCKAAMGHRALKDRSPSGPFDGLCELPPVASKPVPGDTLRAFFFSTWDHGILPPVIKEAQSDTWTSDFYACKRSSVAGARMDRQETFDLKFYAWHWRLGAEQLLYSHQSIEPSTHRPRFMSNTKPMLLACGTEDHVPFNDICPNTQRVAPLMTMTPGKAIFLQQTGHSLDNERRTFFAKEIVAFLGL